VELTGITPRTVEGSSTVGADTISVSVLETASDGSVLSYTATTGRDGRFEIRNIRPGGDYQLVALPLPNFLPAQFGQRVPAVPGRSLMLTAGEALKDVRIEMTPSAGISGQIVDSTGRGMKDVVVELRRPWYLEGWRLLAQWNELIGRVQGVGKTNIAAVTRTNSRGEFRFDGLAPAQYYIRTDFINEDKATPVNLRAGANLNSVKIVAPDLRFHTVAGTVFDRGGVPVRFARVSVIQAGVNPLYRTRMSNLQTAESGAFEITVPAPGRYILLAEASGRPAALRGRKEIDVRDGNLRNVRIQVAPRFDISGNVTFEGGLPPAVASGGEPLSLSFYPMSAGLPDIKAVKLPGNKGSFTVEGVSPGNYRCDIVPILTVPPGSLLPAPLENAYVKSIRLDGEDVLNGGVHLESESRGTLQIVVSMNGGTVEGHVIASDATPAPNVKTVVVPNGPRRHRGDLYKFVSTDDAGRFQLKGLAPGEYKLFGFERVEEGAWQDPEFIKLFDHLGAALRVEEGRRLTMDVKLIPAWN